MCYNSTGMTDQTVKRELSMSSKRSLPLVLTGLLLGTTTSAMAGSQSLLDPYATIAAPATPQQQGKKGSKKATQAPVAQAPAQEAPQTSTTYVTMPMQDHVKGKAKVTTAPVSAPSGGQSTTAQAGGPTPQAADNGGILSGVKEIQQGCSNTVKACGSSVVNSTKAAGSKIVAGGKFVSNGVTSGTKKIGTGFATIGGGIASGARSSGSYLAKGAKAIGHGFMVTGEKVKDSTEAVGGKVAHLPKIWGKGDDKLKQTTIANGVKTTTTIGKIKPSPLIEQPKPATQDQVAQTPAPTAQPAQAKLPPTNAQSAITQLQPISSQPKQGMLAGISGSFSKAMGKFKFFGGKKDDGVANTANGANRQTASSGIPQ